MTTPAARWDEMYAAESYIFGTEPNDFLAEVLTTLAPCPVLSLGEGEGRNGVWMAEHGFAVTGIDASPVGVEKARRLARARGVDAEFRVGDLAVLDLDPGAWPLIVSVFAHTPPEVRGHVHRQVVRGLAPGGRYVMEAYHPDQIGLGTGGPPDPALLVSAADAQRELAGLDFEILRETHREVTEGERHTGRAAVTQVVARRP